MDLDVGHYSRWEAGPFQAARQQASEACDASRKMWGQQTERGPGSRGRRICTRPVCVSRRLTGLGS